MQMFCVWYTEDKREVTSPFMTGPCDCMIPVISNLICQEIILILTDFVQVNAGE